MMLSLKFEYVRFENGFKFIPVDETVKLAFERSVNILYEDYAEKINCGRGSFVMYFNDKGKIQDEFMLLNFPPDIPDYKASIAEIIHFI